MGRYELYASPCLLATKNDGNQLDVKRDVSLKVPLGLLCIKKPQKSSDVQDGKMIIKKGHGVFSHPSCFQPTCRMNCKKRPGSHRRQRVAMVRAGLGTMD